MQNYIRSVARTYHWTPQQIAELFVDDLDSYGLIFWYNDALEMQKEIEKTK